MSTENNGNENKPTNRDLWRAFLHQLTIRSTNNYERQWNAGFTKAMIPVIEKYYEDPEERKEACARHTGYLPTGNITSATPMRVVAIVEERCTTEGDIDPNPINAVKTALVGPLARLGDSLLSGTAGPILAGIAISLITVELDQIGPVSFVIGMSIVLLGVRYLGVFQSYKQGVRFAEKIQSSGLINKASELATIAAYAIAGEFIPALVIISIPIMRQSDDTVFNIQETLDGLMPDILGMLCTGPVYLLISKRKILTAELTLVTIIVGIVGTYCGVLE